MRCLTASIPGSFSLHPQERLFQCLPNQDNTFGQFVNVFMVHPETLSTGHGLLCLQKPKECKGWGTNAEMITI